MKYEIQEWKEKNMLPLLNNDVDMIIFNDTPTCQVEIYNFISNFYKYNNIKANNDSCNSSNGTKSNGSNGSNGNGTKSIVSNALNAGYSFSSLPPFVKGFFKVSTCFLIKSINLLLLTLVQFRFLQFLVPQFLKCKKNQLNQNLLGQLRKYPKIPFFQYHPSYML